ncbi:RNA polymerase sigma factor [Paenibacillus tengchongensis]|uniref:RNA polymerase sigma factor n=1 Tax=Paenibacillus tengchongensis TaxID=2608684 RepID=UPI001FE5F3D2|nr:sigma-70 family RNA polymerase sigma factor [Paenibacillus tengchongensis]
MVKGELPLDIIEGIKAKDESALRLLMERYGDMLLRTAWLLLKDRQAAEEAVQDTFIQAYAKIGQLEDPQRLRGWLVAIAVNRCRMRQRTWSWRSIFPAAAAVIHADEDTGGGAGAEALFMMRWEQVQLGEAIRSLDYIYRECLTLYYYHEMSVKEIAGQLKLPENTVKSRLARGRALLRRILEKEGLKDGQ